ncbi:unnamed protein product [Prunus armeniaca]
MDSNTTQLLGAPSPPSSSSTNSWTHDVFLSFREISQALLQPKATFTTTTPTLPNITHPATNPYHPPTTQLLKTPPPLPLFLSLLPSPAPTSTVTHPTPPRPPPSLMIAKNKGLRKGEVVAGWGGWLWMSGLGLGEERGTEREVGVVVVKVALGWSSGGGLMV